LFDQLARDSRIRIVPSPGPFNYSEINNRGAAQARGEVLLFLNNDVEAISPGWLREMVGLALRGDIGCVGAKLLYPDERIQHAGVVLQEGPLAMHVFRLMNACDVGYDGQLAGVRTYSVVTAACLAVRKELFDRCGGFDQDNLEVSFNDVDLCLRIEEMGYRNLCTPFATLLHRESASRGSESSRDEVDRSRRELDFIASKWADRFRLDSFHHPSLHFSWDGSISQAPGGRSFCAEAIVSR
jgi:GT2 family glycosyltransferase